MSGAWFQLHYKCVKNEKRKIRYVTQNIHKEIKKIKNDLLESNEHLCIEKKNPGTTMRLGLDTLSQESQQSAWKTSEYGAFVCAPNFINTYVLLILKAHTFRK